MKTLQAYQQDIKQADTVRRIVSMPEFKCIEQILKRMYDDDVDKIIAGENPIARARLQFNKDFQDEIQADIQRGDVATEAIKEERFDKGPQEG